jgi:hypothetical protein
LVRCCRDDDRLAGIDGRPVGGADADRTAVAHDNLVDVDVAEGVAAALGDQTGERISEAAASPHGRWVACRKRGESEGRPQGTRWVLGAGAKVEGPRRREGPELLRLEVVVYQAHGAAAKQLTERKGAFPRPRCGSPGTTPAPSG